MDASDCRERIYDVFSRADDDVTTRVERALDIGAEYLNLSVGGLTRIDEGIQEIAVATVGERPGATVDVRVDTDWDVCAGAELERALSEHGTNAVEHHPDADPHVAPTATDDGDWIELVVADDGTGIDGMETAVIVQGEESEMIHGSGLGLWLVNWIVTRYGGAFQIPATDGGPGSVATLRLPAMGTDAAVEEVERGPTVLFR